MVLTPIDSYEAASSFLEDRIGHGVRPGLERIRDLLELMTDPQDSYATIHVAGTNGKTTTVWLIERLLSGHGLRIGSYTSPHLEEVEDRFTIAGRRFDRDALTQAVADVASFIEIYEEKAHSAVTYFETTVAMAFQAFAAAGVDVAVVEVGLGGRLDATNVLDSDVAVVTGIALDHTTILGDSLGEIATEKAAILKSGGTLVTGPLPPAAEGPVTARVANTGAVWHRYGDAFGVAEAVRAVGGWSVTIDGIEGRYSDLFLPLHGRHQVDHLATAIAAAEVFFQRPLEPDNVAAAVAGVKAPGRIEVIQRSPLVVIDGAHNAEGLTGLADALHDEFPEATRRLVVGFRGDRDVADLLAPLEGLFDGVFATQAQDELAVPSSEVAAAARKALPGLSVEEATPVAQAMTEALHASAEEDIVVVAGSLYVAGEARSRVSRKA